MCFASSLSGLLGYVLLDKHCPPGDYMNRRKEAEKDDGGEKGAKYTWYLKKKN